MIVLILLVAILALFLAALVISFTARDPRRRRAARITAITVSSLSVLAIGGCLIAFRMFFGPSPPTIGELQKSFPHQRADLESILRMSDEDKGFWRIDPDWLGVWRDTVDQAGQFQPNTFMKDDPHAPLPKARWDQYRSIYRRNDIRQGIERNKVGDAFILVQSEGLLNRGHTSGYLYCTPHPLESDPGSYRYQPCTSANPAEAHPYTGGQEAYSFQKLDDHWFAYSRGPG